MFKTPQYKGGSKPVVTRSSNHKFTTDEVEVILHANAANRDLSSMLEKKLLKLIKG